MESNIIVRELHPEEFAVAVEMISRGMRDNPLHIQAFGVSPESRLASLNRVFAIVIPLVSRRGAVLGAFKDNVLLGVVGMVAPGKYQLTAIQSLKTLPRLLSALGVPPFLRVGQWMAEWKKQDLREPHWHLGPVAVDTHLQGQGIGSALMVEYCRRLDQDVAVGYLETDKPMNVSFYKKSGFETIAEANVLGIPNWFMRRSATARQPGGA